MQWKCGAFFAMTIIAFGPAIGAEATSPSAMVWVDPSGSLLWRTILETPAKVSIDWPKEAARAVLTASCGGKETVRETLTDKSVKVHSLAFILPQAESDETVVDISLAFFDSSGAPLSGSARTASVGLVRGVGNRSFRLIPDGEQNGRWRKVMGSAVAPVYGDTASVSFDGVQLPLACRPGWAYLAGVSPALHSLVLASEGGSSRAVPIVGMGGAFLIVK